MKLEEKETENLFSYGTLQDEAVQLLTFGRRLAGESDILVGYSLRMIQVTDQNFASLSGSEHQRTVKFTGVASDQVEGIVLKLIEGELTQADAYEPDGYERMLVSLKSGVSAWIYVNISHTNGADSA